MKKTEKKTTMSVKELAAMLAEADVELFEDESTGIEDEASAGQCSVQRPREIQPPLF